MSEELKLIDAQPFDDQEARRWANWQLTPIEGSSSPYLVGTNQRGAASLLSAMARIKELEAQVEAARAEGYQQGIEDAASFIQTSPHYFEGLDRDADRIAEDMRAMLLGAKLPDPADLPTMMSLRGILNSDEDSEEKETDYNPVPPKATYTAMARFKLVGRGKPLDQ